MVLTQSKSFEVFKEMNRKGIMEIWKSIPNCSKYEVSNLFRVRNKKTSYMLKVVKTEFNHPFHNRVGVKHDQGGDLTLYLDDLVLFLF